MAWARNITGVGTTVGLLWRACDDCRFSARGLYAAFMKTPGTSSRIHMIRRAHVGKLLRVQVGVRPEPCRWELRRRSRRVEALSNQITGAAARATRAITSATRIAIGSGLFKAMCMETWQRGGGASGKARSMGAIVKNYFKSLMALAAGLAATLAVMWLVIAILKFDLGAFLSGV